MNDAWLYVVLLGAAAVIYAFLIPKSKTANQPLGNERMVREVEKTLEQYMAEMEKENDDLVNLLVQIRQETGAKQSALQEQLADMRGRLADMEKTSGKHEAKIEQLSSADLRIAQQAAVQLRNELLEKAVTAPPEPEVLPEPEDSVRQRYPQLFELHDQGKSVDAIAKVVGLQRGEIQLILRLAKREEG
ncbi:hypothetical protein [Saccharibacillus sp. JS10]|uniref:hypothetical protein n=1 Tax=Saccharibacillus sp. JS10 TaxID=2950552 RepID=UPI002109029F|nr:hypothetical protein [Saccharibacillus sp. JS10]MCQ4087217.1 hypothetical protein [Saccharibacillus sp. JS10]